ncbi:ATP-dependent DNA ligase [Paenibacillus medicaginis]|uniref:RNA ligase family protein n=1 Tax=Paenibacillus medicaginis TaxID=1470560 RepID=A0ABV5BVF6_9BACL
MKKVFEIVDKVSKTSSRNEKESILKQNINNELLKRTLEYTYNPYKIFNVGSKTFTKKSEIVHSRFNNIFELMDWLLQRNASDETKLEINSYIARQPEDEQEWYKRMLLKDLREGCTESTYNKIWPNLVPTFEVMLAKKFEEHEHKITDDFVVTLKLDGVRCVILKENGQIKLISRQGKLFEDMNELIEELRQLPDNIAYDGELLLRNEKNLSSADLYRETMREISKIGEKYNVEFHCFDMIPMEEFKSGKSKQKCVERKEELNQLLQEYGFKLIKLVPVLYKGRDRAEVFKLLDEAIKNGFEGLMVNQNRPYECKRSDAILKMKKFHEADVRVLEVVEGTGKNVGKLGSILIQFEYEGEHYTCNVGSGFSDAERVRFYDNPEILIGKIVTVGYFELSQNQDDSAYSMRFPTWKGRIREDKNEISMH